jgi:hypothetical protein
MRIMRMDNSMASVFSCPYVSRTRLRTPGFLSAASGATITTSLPASKLPGVGEIAARTFPIPAHHENDSPMGRRDYLPHLASRLPPGPRADVCSLMNTASSRLVSNSSSTSSTASRSSVYPYGNLPATTRSVLLSTIR